MSMVVVLLFMYSVLQTWVGRMSDLGKKGFHKKCKNLDDIAVYIWLHIKNKSEK